MRPYILFRSAQISEMTVANTRVLNLRFSAAKSMSKNSSMIFPFLSREPSSQNLTEKAVAVSSRPQASASSPTLSINGFAVFLLAARHNKQAYSALARCVGCPRAARLPVLQAGREDSLWHPHIWPTLETPALQSGHPHSLLRSHRKYGWVI